MDIEKANYGTIVRFGQLSDLKNKIKMENTNISNIVNWTDEEGVSLLERSLISRKFEISKYLIENNARINNVSKDGCNEFHYLAASINSKEALEIAYMLLWKGTSLMQKDLKYGNIALFSLCIEAFKERSKPVMQFIQECLKNATDIDEQNNRGISVRQLIYERGDDETKKIVEEIYG